jgi:hypothetical protein
VVRVLGYRSRGPGFHSLRYQMRNVKKEENPKALMNMRISHCLSQLWGMFFPQLSNFKIYKKVPSLKAV